MVIVTAVMQAIVSMKPGGELSETHLARVD